MNGTLPLPLGEVAERSEDGEGKLDCNTLSVTFGDSSPRGRAKGPYRYAPFPVLRPPMKGAAAAFRPEFARLPCNYPSDLLYWWQTKKEYILWVVSFLWIPNSCKP